MDVKVEEYLFAIEEFRVRGCRDRWLMDEVRRLYRELETDELRELQRVA